MTNFILTTKLYVPLPRPELARGPRLIKKLNEGLHHKLTLISAPAGFGKTTLVSDWIASMQLDGEKVANYRVTPKKYKTSCLAFAR